MFPFLFDVIKNLQLIYSKNYLINLVEPTLGSTNLKGQI